MSRTGIQVSKKVFLECRVKPGGGSERDDEECCMLYNLCILHARLGFVELQDLAEVSFEFISPENVCIFCDSKADSKEHIFPKWAAPFFPELGRAHITFLNGTDAQDGLLHRPGAQSSTLKVVCQYCNNSWMSRIQDEARPILLRYLNGATAAPTADERRILTRWALMVSFVQEFSDYNTIATSKWVREQFRESLAVPDNHDISFFLYAEFGSGFNHVAWRVVEDRVIVVCGEYPLDPPMDERVTFISFGFLGVIVRSSEHQDITASSYYEETKNILLWLNLQALMSGHLVRFASKTDVSGFLKLLVHPMARDRVRPLGSTSTSRRSGRRRPIKLRFDGSG